MSLTLIEAILSEFSSLLLALFVGNSFLPVKLFLNVSMVAVILFSEPKEDSFVFALYNL